MSFLVFIDVETNGSRSMQMGHHRVIQLAYVACTSKGNIEFSKFVRQSHVPQEITQLTGITLNDVLEYGISEHTIALHLQKMMQCKPIFVAHNCQFDLHMIFELLCRQLGQFEAYNLVSNCKWLDTLTVVRDRYSYGKYSHKLEDCIKHYNLQGVTNSHNAMDDVRALHALYQALMTERRDAVQYINVFGYNNYYPHNEEFDFIEYKPQSNDRGFVNSDAILPAL